jgi:hypothetical protein
MRRQREENLKYLDEWSHNCLDRDFFFGSSWIPASAGMTSKNHAFLMFVTPAKPGVQFEVLKRKRIPVNDAGTIMDPFVRQISSIKY